VQLKPDPPGSLVNRKVVSMRRPDDVFKHHNSLCVPVKLVSVHFQDAAGWRASTRTRGMQRLVMLLYPVLRQAAGGRRMPLMVLGSFPTKIAR